MKRKIFFTADQHFGHQNIIQYCNRPYGSLEQMDEALIEGWNEAVGPVDEVYHLGDFTFGAKRKAQSYFSRLNGRIHALVGDHDKRWFPKQYGESGYHSAGGAPVEILPPLYTLKTNMVGSGRLDIVLCHYAMRVWPKSHYGSIHLHGHSHGRLPAMGKSMDVGVDAVGNSPIGLHEVVKRLKDSD